MHTLYQNSFESFIFTGTAAAALLGARFCRNLQVFDNCVLAVVEFDHGGRMSRFLPKSLFFQYFALSRRWRGQDVKVIQDTTDGSIFWAQSQRSLGQYKVQIYHKKITCDCADFRNQTLTFGGRPCCCKHGYAVLGVLGYQSLADYANRQTQEWEIKFTNG